MIHKRRNPVRGFTLIEILVVIGMLAILSTIVLVAVNPLRQFAQARNTQRQNDVAAVLNAISERIADNGGTFLSNSSDGCTAGLPGSKTDVTSTNLDLRPCLVPTYISELPHDPSTGSNTCHSASCNSTNEAYDLHYTVQQDGTTNRINVCASGYAESAIPGSTEFCLTR